MTFLNPTIALVGLACIAIPIIIHILMRRRRRPVPWAAMKFLIEAYRRQRRRMNLEQLLLLASRCLLVALLALALGKPVLGALGALTQGPRTLYLMIDNGLASGAASAGETTPALERSKSEALNLIKQLDQAQGDRVGIVALAGPSEPLVVPPTADLAAAGELIRALTPMHSRTDLAGGLARLRDELRRAPMQSGDALWLALMSDFRAGSADLEATLAPLAANEGQVSVLALGPATQPLDNTAITAVEPARSVLISTSEAGAAPTASTPVRVVLHRSGPGVNTAAVSTISVDAVSATVPAAPATGRAQTRINWAPGQDTASGYVTVDVPIPAQGSRTPVTLVATIDADAIAGDNTFRRPIDTRERLEVALLAPGAVGGKSTIDNYTPADWLALALAPEADPMRRRQSGEIRVTALDPARALAPLPGSRNAAGMLADFDAIIISNPDLVDAAGWRLVRAAADLGALVLVTPPAGPKEGVQIHTWTDAMLAGLSLQWQIGRESRTLSPAATLPPERLTPSGPDLLELLAAEMPELVKSVTVSQVLPLTGGPGAFETLLRLADGSPLLVMAQPGAASDDKTARASRGMVLFMTAAPDTRWTDLPTKPLMVPLIQELVRQGVGRSAGPRTAVAGGLATLPPGAAELAPIGEPAEGEPQQPPIQLDANSQPARPIRTAGLWAARSSAGTTLGVLAFNADPAGSATDTRSREEIARWLTPIASELTWIEPGSGPIAPGSPPGETAATGALTRDTKIPPISFPLLIAALAVAVIETGLARWFSHARAETGLIRATAGAQAAEKGAAA
ncbi:MAG TPA: BatA domain-containing protein [Phycisphaerales bacterium]|nr:BatA domain-containing protein [Phycisphaerales bacterium]